MLLHRFDDADATSLEARLTMTPRPLMSHEETQQALRAARTVTSQRGDARAQPGVVTVTMAAATHGVRRDNIKAARRLLLKATPEVLAAVEAGRIGLRQALRYLRLVPKLEHPQETWASLLDQPGPLPPTRVLLRRKGAPQPVRVRTRPLAWRMGQGLDHLEGVLETLEENLAEPNALAHREARAWLIRIRRATRTLQGFIAAFKREGEEETTNG